MGSYYAGVMNSDYDSELKHHGIKGQRWGVRRFQNPDGTWTAAGKERYGGNSDTSHQKSSDFNGDSTRASGYSNTSDRDRKKLIKMVNARPRNIQKIKEQPVIVKAAKELSDKASPIEEASSSHDRLRDELRERIYGDKETYEKWLDKAVDKEIKSNPDPDNSPDYREKLKKWYRIDDGNQGENGVFETYVRESKDPLAKKYAESEKRLAKLETNLRNEADRIANEILGDSASKMDKFWVSTFIQNAAKKTH